MEHNHTELPSNSVGAYLIAAQREHQRASHKDDADDSLTLGQLAGKAIVRIENALSKDENHSSAYALLLVKAGALVAAELDRVDRAGGNLVALYPHLRTQQSEDSRIPCDGSCTHQKQGVRCTAWSYDTGLGTKGLSDPLRSFCRELIDGSFEGATFDGGQIQEIAVKHGLLREVQATKACGETCACAEVTDFPATCYRYTEIMQTRDFVWDAMIERACQSLFGVAYKPDSDAQVAHEQRTTARQALEDALNGSD